IFAHAKAVGKDTVTVRAWLPFPAACDAQSEIVLHAAQPEGITAIAPETAPARSVYWEFEATENPSFSLEYAYTQTARYTQLPVAGGNVVKSQQGYEPPQDMNVFAPYLAEQAPHAIFTPYLRALVAELTEGFVQPLEKARAIYDYITLNVHYRYMPPYFMLENIAENCAMSRRGDCGVMAICFITMCRIAGIPAHWESGLAVSPSNAGCHDWARFYIAPYGWLYADCSYGSSAAREEAEVRRTHYFGNLDPYRMVANNTFFAPLTPEKHGWRADPCDNQSGEMELEGIGLMGQDLNTDVTVISAE
ncbi:MAG: transglutaminase-like domain-containing protein, partial [Faecalibacterium sp.]